MNESVGGPRTLAAKNDGADEERLAAPAIGPTPD
jgi:hypothetical protein